MKIKKSEKGVSEVVGSILILMITVTMFAVVMLWVVSYPTPSGRAYVDLNAEVNGQYVNISHFGGESLENDDTVIYVYINSSLAGSYKISDADNYASIGDSLSVGETWSKTFTSITGTSTVWVVIVDTKGSEVIYDKIVQGVSGNNKPVVAFACTVPSSVPADGSTGFKIYAYILDPDKDVSTVAVNLSSVGKSTYSMSSTDKIIFKSSSLTIPVGTLSGRYICQIDATDSNSNTATGYVWITVTDPSVLGGGGFAGESSSYGDQGFMITNDFNSTTDMRIFNQTDTIWVKMASNVLTNVRINNLFRMKDVYGNILTPPTSSSAFIYYKYEGGYYFYVYSFEVKNIQGISDDGGVYPTHIELKDYSGHVFIVDTTIIVKDINGGIPSYGTLKTYSNAACTVESSWFDSEGMMYVKVFTKTVGGADSAIVGNIEIRDFIGGAQVKRRPGNEPVSNITKVGGNYSFSINLSNANQDPWLHPGNNTYTLFVRNFTDADESYQNLALQVIIYAPAKMLDIIAGIDEAQDPAWKTKDYLYFYENDNYWTRTCLEHDPNKVVSILDVAVGDMDEDGDLDVVGGAEAKYVYLYDNLKGDGSKWNRTTIDDLTSTGEKPWCVEVGDMDGDGAVDIVVGTDSKNVYLYLNDGAWTRSAVSTGEGVYSIAVSDFDRDDSLDIAVGRSSGKITIYLNRGNGTFRGEPGTPTYYYANAEWIAEGNITGGNYLNTMASDNVYENLTEGWTTSVGPTTNDNAISDIPVLGTRTNTYTATFIDDGIYEKIKEVTDSGINKIDHRWTITLTAGGESWVFNVEAKRELGAQGDDNFDFYYSTTGSFTGEEVKMLTVTTTSSGVYYNYTFPEGSLGGVSTIYIRAVDTNRDAADDAGNEQDTLSIDRMYIATTQPNSTYSSLTHVWRIPDVKAGEASYSFYVEANHTSNSENDNFTFQYSINNATWYDMLNVTKTTDDNVLQTYSFPAINGTIYIRVVDTNSTGGYTVNDTLYVDKMFIRSMSAETESISFTAGSSTINCLATADLDGDGSNDIAAGDSSGIVWQCINSGTGTVFAVSQVADAGSTVNGIGIGNLVGTSKLDIAVGTSGGKVYVYENDGSWTRTEVASTGVTIYDLAVGDMESDGDDDIVIATGSGQTVGGVHYYENDGSWTGTVVDNCGTPVFCVTVGDING